MSKKTNKFDYPHPLIKNLKQSKSFSTSNIPQFIKQKPTFYDTNYAFSPSIKTLISPKLLRLSNAKIVPDQKFGILMQPFCRTQQVQMLTRSKEDQPNWKCKTCQAFLNYHCDSVSLYEVKCKVCDSVQQISLEVKHELENVPCCYDVCSEDSESVPKLAEKNVCFVIEASEFNHNFRVAEVIQSSLTSIQSTLATQNIHRKLSQVATVDDEGSLSQNTEISFQNDNEQTIYNISFIMFNDKNIFIINQSTNDVMVFNESFLQSSPTTENQSVINFQDFFKPIGQISQETFELVSEILYESYLTNTSCLDVTSKFIHEWVDKYFAKPSKEERGTTGLNQKGNLSINDARRQVEYKFFVNSLKFTKSTISANRTNEQTESNTRMLFSNVSNLIASNLPSKKSDQNKSQRKILTDESEDQTQPQLALYANYQFFYLPQYQTRTFHSVSQKQVFKKLNNNLYKMYQRTQDQSTKRQTDLFNELYYDLFENLSRQYFFNVKLNIICSQKVQVLAIGNQSLGYNDCSQEFAKVHSASRTGKMFNSYSITLNCLDPSQTLPIDMKILPSPGLKSKKPSLSQTKNFIQIHLQYTKPYLLCGDQPHTFTYQRVFHSQVTVLNRAINYQQHIYASLSTHVDDQTLFYFKLRWIMAQSHKTKTNHTIIKKLHQEMQKMSDNFKDQYGQIDFHKEYVRIFMYAFMILNKPMINGINESFYYDRHIWLKSSMESISKSLYPRTYQVICDKENEKVQLKNVKSSPKNFRSNSLLLLDNGKYLYFIIGQDIPVQELKTIFGTCFIHEITQMTELPDIETNQPYREIVDLARSHHQSNFLPLKIVQLFSRQFDQQVSHLLYLKENHHRYMRQLWQMEPVKRSTRS